MGDVAVERGRVRQVAKARDGGRHRIDARSGARERRQRDGPAVRRLDGCRRCVRSAFAVHDRRLADLDLAQRNVVFAMPGLARQHGRRQLVDQLLHRFADERVERVDLMLHQAALLEEAVDHLPGVLPSQVVVALAVVRGRSHHGGTSGGRGGRLGRRYGKHRRGTTASLGHMHTHTQRGVRSVTANTLPVNMPSVVKNKTSRRFVHARSSLRISWPLRRFVRITGLFPLKVRVQSGSGFFGGGAGDAGDG